VPPAALLLRLGEHVADGRPKPQAPSPTASAGARIPRRFKFSTDPELEAKIRDIVGLYLNPPEAAIVLRVDEKSQTQALDRTAPIPPIRPGTADKQTHDYVRHGTATLFAGLQVATGKVTDACYPRHRNEEFLAFRKQIAKAYPRRQLHIVVDNYATHKHDNLTAWLGKNKRITLHFHADLGVLAEPGRDLLRDHHPQAIRRGTFTSAKDLISAIETFIDGWNNNASRRLDQTRRRHRQERNPRSHDFIARHTGRSGPYFARHYRRARARTTISTPGTSLGPAQ
jgi:DDE superfamily endonuclease